MDPAATIVSDGENSGVEREYASVSLDELRYLCACACSTSLQLSGTGGRRADNAKALDGALAALKYESGRELGHLAWGYGCSSGQEVEEARLPLKDAIASLVGCSGRIWLQERGHTSYSFELMHEFSRPPRLVRQDIVDEVPHLVLACAQDALYAVNLQRTAANRVSTAIIQVEESNGTAFLLRMKIKSVGLDASKLLLSNSASALLLHLIEHDLDENHMDIIASMLPQQLPALIESLLHYIARIPLPEGSEDKLYLKQERAIMVLADALYAFDGVAVDAAAIASTISSNIDTRMMIANAIESKRSNDRASDAYLEFLDGFLRASNEKELSDFELCANQLPSHVSNEEAWRRHPTMAACGASSLMCRSGMRVGISSANASDNWSSAKLRGGAVVNFALHLLLPDSDLHHARVNGSKDALESVMGSSLVAARLRTTDEPATIVLSSRDRLSGELRTTRKRFSNTSSDCADLFSWSDNSDVFRMLKYALFFTGILRDDPGSREDPRTLLEQARVFCCGGGLLLELCNAGPSRSGFASSSAVSANLLKLLFAAASNPIADDNVVLGSYVLLFENRLGLKSGRQDVDGLLAGGLKSIRYEPISGFLMPHIEILPVLPSLANRLVLYYVNPTSLRYFHSYNMHYIVTLNHSAPFYHFRRIIQTQLQVDTGIQRGSGLGLRRGLNMRHLALLSRDPTTFPSLIESFSIHASIISALRTESYERLGELFLAYMRRRERIDSGATASQFDGVMKCRVLVLLFERLKQLQLISGGMLTGAMGGGVAMLVVTDKGMSGLDVALNELRELRGPAGEQPFSKLTRIHYELDVDGLQLQRLD